MTIPTEQVLTAVYDSLLDSWDHVGDGEPLPAPPTDRPHAWVEPQPSPGDGPRMGGGQPTCTVRVRVSTAMVDGDGPEARSARHQATNLADRLRGVMLTDPLWSGDGWRVTGRWCESIAPVREPGAWVIHQDFTLHVSAA